MTDIDFTQAVTDAARGAYERGLKRQEKYRPAGSEPQLSWDELHILNQNDYREAALPYVLDSHRDIARQAILVAADSINTHLFGPTAAPYVSAVKAELRTFAKNTYGEE